MHKNYMSLAVALKKLIGRYSNVQYVNQSAVWGLDDDRKVRVTLDMNGRSNRYERLHVEIISKTAGKIVAQSFLFSDYLKREQKTSSTPDHCYLWKSQGKIEWYGEIPSDKDVKKLQKDVLEWIDIWV